MAFDPRTETTWGTDPAAAPALGGDDEAEGAAEAAASWSFDHSNLSLYREDESEDESEAADSEAGQAHAGEEDASEEEAPPSP